MKLFSNPRAKRNTACVVLLVWLFALTAGIANACLLEAPGTHHDGGVTAAVAASHPPVLRAGHAGAVDAPSDGSGASSTACLKVCDDGARSAPKAFCGIDRADPGPATVTTLLWTGGMAVHSSARPIELRAPRVSALPIRIRFARLAL